MLTKQKVLIIEDSPLAVKILKNMLENEYEILSAFSGSDGYEIAISKIPDIIILDVLMTGMDGYEVCKKLKNNNLTKNIPVIFISALGEMEDEKRGLEAGAIDYITKPFSEPIVKIRIKNHLELKRNRDILSELSSLDGLTGLYNRRFFNDSIVQLWEKAIINKTPLSLLMADIDHFKIYNDNYGHLEGDECLRLVAQCIKDCTDGNENIVARFGGEEFICLMPETELNGAFEMADKILKEIPNLKIPFVYSSVADVVTVSIGSGTIYPSDAVLMIDFIKSVDDLLYKSKRNGRNQIQYEMVK